MSTQSLFFASVHCGKPGVGSGAHCDRCRTSRSWRQNIAATFDIDDIDFPCPWGRDSVVDPAKVVWKPESLFDQLECREKQACEACRLDPSFRKTIIERYDVGQAENNWFSCPRGVTSEDFKERPYPALVEQAKNAAGAAGRAASALIFGKKMLVGGDEFEKRFFACQSCAVYDRQRNRCRKCGCLAGKNLWLKTESCPLNRW